MDGLHAQYPEASLLGDLVKYLQPRRVRRSAAAQHRENYTPGKRATSSYDNNLASWTMSGEYELKKDRDRQFWTGGFLWSGQDYIGVT